MLCSHALILLTGTVLVKEIPLYLAMGLQFLALVVTVIVSATVCYRMRKINKCLTRYNYTAINIRIIKTSVISAIVDKLYE